MWLDLEVAQTPQEKASGLSYRSYLAPNKGMLFVFEDETNHSFWMNNTFIPLDMIFMNSAMTVVGTLENVPVNNAIIRKIDQNSKYVIEVNAGFVKKHNIHIGQTLSLQV